MKNALLLPGKAPYWALRNSNQIPALGFAAHILQLFSNPKGKRALLLFIISFTVSSSFLIANPEPPQKEVPIKNFLDEKGVLRVPKDFKGEMDLEGYDIQIDEALGVIAQPANSTTSDLNGGVRGKGGGRAIIADNLGNVYVGGEFRLAGDTHANYVAKWDGTTWSALGSGLNGICYALDVDGSGNLYVGGAFTTAGGIPANRIAKWDGTTWSALGSGLDGACFAISSDVVGTLYVGGSFTQAGGQSASRIAKWNGTSWSALGSGLNGTCYSIGWLGGGTVYAGGSFSSPGNNIAKWDDGFGWSSVGTGLSGTCFVVRDRGVGGVWAGGSFAYAGGVLVNNIAKWQGGSWSALAGGLNGTCRSIFGVNNVIYVAGDFSTAGTTGFTSNRIAHFNGLFWTSYGTALDDRCNSLTADQSGNVFLAGDFSLYGSTLTSGVAMLYGPTLNLGKGISRLGWVRAMVHDGVGSLYVAGRFEIAGNIKANNIARWDGTNWVALGKGLNAPCNALAITNIGVYAGGTFTSAGGVNAKRIAFWDGNNWSALGSGLSGQPCQALTVDAGGTVYAGGAFSSAGGAPNTQYIAKWNGSSWSSVGTGINNICYALEADGTGNVYAGGAFTNAGGNTAKYIARWDGSNWFSLGTGLGGACRGIGVDGSGQVFAGGNFTGAGGITANHIAKWDGSNWSALGNGLSGSCEEVAVDANGNVYAVGSNVAIPGVAGQGLAVWNGSIWQGPCGGINTSSISNPNNSSLFIQAVLVFNSELFVGGIFSSAFNQSAFNIASGLLPNILQPPPSVDVQSTCGPFTWIDGNTYTASNNSATYTLIGGAANGCDSIVNLDLTINQPTTGIDIQISCGPFIWIDGNTYTASNNSATYTLVGGAANGCDSTVTLDLTINQVATGIDVQVSCGPFIWIDGNTYTASNNSATFTLIGAAANGCDSTVALDLTINQVSTGIDVQTSCGPFTWIDGNTYAASNNSATFTLIGAAANGCDSTVALDVTINQAATGTDAQINCGPFTWIDGNTYTASNNTATYTIIGGAANGCDSIVSLDLTVNQVATGVDVQVNCGPFTWIDGNTYTASNNSATFTLVGGAANGCDSIVSLYLTVNQLATGVDVQINCGPFTWIDGNTYTSSNNSATYTIIGGAANGCDSIVSLDLTVNQPQTGTDVQVSCGSFIWIDGNTYTSSNNTASYTLVGGAANGCDSTVQLDLTINQIDPSVVDAGTSLIAAQQQATYQWLDCDLGFSPIPNETSDAFSPSRSGNYAVEISLGTCKDTSSCVNYLAVGINEGFAEQISFYPNPTKEVITIELSRSFPEIEVQIMDVWGRTLTKKMLYNQERFELPIQDPPGTYFIQIRAQAWGVSTFKVLKR